MLENRSLFSQFIRFALATVTSLMVYSLYSIVDGLMVAKGVGEYAMAAVNLAVPFSNVLFSLGVAFGVGTSTIIAMYLGQGRRENANSLFSQNIALLTAIGLTLTLLVMVFTEPFARLLGADGVTLDYTVEYLRGLAPFALCFMVSYNMEILVKTDGFPKIAILTVITGCLTNCVLDYVAIFILGWGVWGAAAATGASQLLTCIIYLFHFTHGKATFRLVKFKPDWGIYRRLIPIGMADGITELCLGLMTFIFNHVIIFCIGDRGLVSYSIIAYTNSLVLNTMMGISQGSQPLVSFNYGKGDEKNCKKLLKYEFGAIGLMTCVIVAAVMLLAPQLVKLFLGSRDAGSVLALRRYGLAYLIMGFNILMGGYLTAVEQPKSAFCISMGRGLAVQALVLVALAFTLGGDAIWFAPVISEGLCFVMAVELLRRFLRKNTTPNL